MKRMEEEKEGVFFSIPTLLVAQWWNHGYAVEGTKGGRGSKVDGWAVGGFGGRRGEGGIRLKAANNFHSKVAVARRPRPAF